MSERQYLLVVLGFLALTECLFWVRRGGVVFRQLASRLWRVAFRSEAIGNEHGDLHWCFPLPPAGRVFIARSWAFSASPRGLAACPVDCLHPFGQPCRPSVFFEWAAIREVMADGKALRINGQELFRSDSPYEPLRVATHIRELVRQPAELRVNHLRELYRTSFDLAAMKAVHAEFSKQTSGWVAASTGLWLFLMVLCPLIVWRFGWLPALWWLVPALLLQSVGITAGFVRHHRRLYPLADDDRFKLAMVFALAPVSASRAPDSLSRPLLGSFHPLCVAAGFLSRADFQRLAERIWRDLRYPRPVPPESRTPEVGDVEVWFRSETLTQVEGLLRAMNVEFKGWEQSPAPSDPAHMLYCSRCMGQFTAEATSCNDCGGRPLRPLLQPR